MNAEYHHKPFKYPAFWALNGQGKGGYNAQDKEKAVV